VLHRLQCFRAGVGEIESHRHGQVGVFQNRPEILTKLAGRLSPVGNRLSFCYEAGPCGYGLQRLLAGCGHDCIVVAPSLIPTKTGDRVKTDRRDARMLAKLHRAGELTPIWIPDAAHEAMRDWYGRGRRRDGCWRKRASTCKAFCYGTSGFTAQPVPGRSPTTAG